MENISTIQKKYINENIIQNIIWKRIWKIRICNITIKNNNVKK